MPGDPTPQEAHEALWTALKDYYPAFDLVVGTREQAWRREFGARVAAAPDLPHAYAILAELVTRFHDYHTGLVWPGCPPFGLPPVRLGWVEGRVAVLAAGPGTSLHPGDVVLRIDDKDALAAFQAALATARGATKYARQAWACERILDGLPDSSVQLRVRGATGRQQEAVLRRVAGRPREVPVVAARDLGPDAGLIRVAVWVGDDLISLFDAALDRFRQKPYLVIDVRGNGGGQDGLADQVTGRFLKEPVVSSLSFQRVPKTNTYEESMQVCSPRGPWRYEGRVAVLTDEGCMSACEHFVSGMKASGEVLIVGRPTTGACGWQRRVDLPGGAILWCSITLPFHGSDPSPLHGIRPHLLVLPTLAGLRAGRDEALNAALGHLRSGRPLPEEE